MFNNLKNQKMLIKLTYQGKGTPTLVNLQNVKNIYPILDKRNDVIVTKIEFLDGSYVNVEEDIKKIYEIQWLMMNGSCNMEWTTPTVDDMIQNSYHQYTDKPERNGFRKRTYRNYDNQGNY